MSVRPVCGVSVFEDRLIVNGSYYNLLFKEEITDVVE